MHLGSTVAVLSLCAGAVATVGMQSPAPADLVLRGGRVITLDAGSRVTEAIAVRENRIVAVGSNAEIERFVGPNSRVVELTGRSVTPGFIDAHTHTEHTAEFQTFWVPIHSPPLPDSKAILERVRERVSTVPAGTWSSRRAPSARRCRPLTS
jgi:predicted amidohydrolase YtcJ